MVVKVKEDMLSTDLKAFDLCLSVTSCKLDYFVVSFATFYSKVFIKP